uniref:Uncharacterized protein n=1 Tax=Candidatus Methanogaster sp. ANME-2c ERB4 TaxID=2759911 RepID=A0A7G9YEK0_9EURY|nr:hypothetical protein KCGBEFIM_00009 [Methanosarcinales archaeon ANME-2c ERB4]
MPDTSKPVATCQPITVGHSPDMPLGFIWHDAQPLTIYTMNMITIIIMRCGSGVGAFPFLHLVMIMRSSGY